MQDLRTKHPRFPASDKQLAYLRALADARRIDLDARLRSRWGCTADELDSLSCSFAIDLVKEGLL